MTRPSCDQLHHILVGGQDRYLGAGLDRMPRIGRDQVVGLEIVQLDLADAERVGGPAHMLALRHEIVGHLAAVRLVLIVKLVAEAAAGGVEDHRDVVGVGLAQILVQHVAEDRHDLGRHAVGFALEPLGLGVARPREIGAEDEPRPVDQKHMARRRRWRRVGGGRALGDLGGGITSSIARSPAGSADLARRRALALALAAGPVRRLRHDADLLGDPAGLRHRPIDIAARAVRTLDPALAAPGSDRRGDGRAARRRHCRPPPSRRSRSSRKGSLSCQ